MKDIKGKVKILLAKYPQTRDCNYKLYGNFLHIFYPETRQVSLFNYLKQMTEGNYPKLETITRCSRQLQEKYTELRGLEWSKRQRQVKTVQENLGYKTN